MEIILASHNQHKMVEVKNMFNHDSVTILTLDQFPEIGDIEEKGKTFKENALIKARTVHKLLGRPAIGDDTGLEVDALGGAPGIYSARYAGDGVSYDDNVRKLLQEMSGIKIKDRTARFRTVAVYVDDRTELVSEGKIEGMITLKRKGSSGFGYDPVFFVPELNRTFAELSAEVKNKISHRGEAFQHLFKLLRVHLGK